MKFGLTDEQISQIQNILVKYPAIIEAVVFGSRAMGNYKEASDVDIALKGDLSSSLAADVKYELEEETYLPFFFDVVAYSALDNVKLKEHIDKHGVSLYHGGWKECKLGDVGLLQRGRSRHRPRYAFHLYGGKYPFIQTGEIREARKYIKKFNQTYSEEGLKQSKLWPKGTLCITIAANIAELAILSFDACFPDSVLGFIPDKEKADLDFVFYTLTHFQKELKHIGEGSVQDNINLGTFEDVLFPFPPLPEQKAIASILSSLDDKIDLLHHQNKTLEAMAETLFRQWFVEEADGRWEDIIITDLFEVRDGTHDSPKQKEIGKPLLTSKHILKNRLDIENAYLISDEDFENVNKRSKVDTNDILFSMIGTIGLLYFEQSSEINYAIKNIGLFKTSQNPAWSYFTYLWLKSSFGQDFIHEHRSGSTQEYISLGSLRSIVFHIPSIEVVEKFNIVIKPYFKKQRNNSKQIRTLEKLRNTLLPKLMNGHIRVEY